MDIKFNLLQAPSDSFVSISSQTPHLSHFTCDDFQGGDQRVGIVHSRNDITFAGLDGRSFVLRSIATQPLTISDDGRQLERTCLIVLHFCIIFAYRTTFTGGPCRPTAYNMCALLSSRD